LFGARVALGGSAKFTMACSPNVTSAQSLPALSESPTPAKPLGEPEPARAGSTAHRATSPAPPEGNVSACGPRASKRHSACPSGSEQRWHEEPAERGNRSDKNACVSVGAFVLVLFRAREGAKKKVSVGVLRVPFADAHLPARS
jgi:hypothetical protein